MTYEQYVYGQVCIAKYKRGLADEAVDWAFTSISNGNGEYVFPKNNAVIAVLITALRNGDATTVELIKGKMKQMQVDLQDEAYFEEILALIESE